MFSIAEATISGLHAAFLRGDITCAGLVSEYLSRISAYDGAGPGINSLITLNPHVRDEARRLDELLARRGLTGPLHGIPVVVKDQIDAAGMPTTLGSVLFRDYVPDQDAAVVASLRSAGALILAKSTLGEFGAGDTHGSLFGSTRNPYDLERTAGGSSGGSAAAVSAGFAPAGLGLEGFASIRRPAAWNCVVGMRPTIGLVSRTGCYSGWPSRTSSVGPITRTVEDAARLLDVISGYDPLDPITALGTRRVAGSFTAHLDPARLRGTRIGILRQPMGVASEPDSADFAQVSDAFEAAVRELAGAGAVVVDDVRLPGLAELLSTRTSGGDGGESFLVWMRRSASPPYQSHDELTADPLYQEVVARRYAASPRATSSPAAELKALLARDRLRTTLLSVMADHDLDVIVHKSVEHTATLIRDGIAPPYTNHKGAPHLNTFIGDVPSLSVPSAFTAGGMPTGITFLGRPYDDGLVLGLAYGYEQATRHRRPPPAVPPLASGMA